MALNTKEFARCNKYMRKKKHAWHHKNKGAKAKWDMLVDRKETERSHADSILSGRTQKLICKHPPEQRKSSV
jgi:hypothetical protein